MEPWSENVFAKPDNVLNAGAILCLRTEITMIATPDKNNVKPSPLIAELRNPKCDVATLEKPDALLDSQHASEACRSAIRSTLQYWQHSPYGGIETTRYAEAAQPSCSYGSHAVVLNEGHQSEGRQHLKTATALPDWQLVCLVSIAPCITPMPCPRRPTRARKSGRETAVLPAFVWMKAV